MLSEAAKNRALKRGPGFWGFCLAHHAKEQLDRCYQVWAGGRPLWFCARCTGLIPALILAIALQMFWSPDPGWWDVLFLGVLPIPAFVDWALARFLVRPGANWLRTLTGGALGISMGRSAVIHSQEAFHPWVLIQWSILLLTWAAVEIIARIRSLRDEP